MAILIALFLLSIIRIYPTVVALNKESNSFRQKIVEVNKGIEEAGKNKDFLASDTYIERQARIRLNVKKPDENVVFVFKDRYNQKPDEPSEIANDNIFAPLKNWQKWWKYIIGEWR